MLIYRPKSALSILLLTFEDEKATAAAAFRRVKITQFLSLPMAVKPPTVTVSEPSTPPVDPLHSAKVTAVLLILLDACIVVINAGYGAGAFGLGNVAVWTVCLVLWSVALMIALFGIVTNRTLLFVPCYVIWCVTFVCSVIFIIVDGYAYTYCDEKSLVNRTGRWMTPCEVYLRTHYPYSAYLLLLLLKMVQLFHVRTLANSIDEKVRNATGEKSVFFLGSKEEQPFLYWIFGKKRSKISVVKKDPDSDDDDMVVFEKVGGTPRGSRPKINDATTRASSIS
ncbi:unnamed protein product [Cylicocyclus nassatus]|uniref:Uncharacterized protein n=1 Tax=Cylicocyclus nassatus TaxID=53992 RepID=A0AA36DL41_CYLNA|nr:unnamed protein product [Cylicocyclus nassatus]